MGINYVPNPDLPADKIKKVVELKKITGRSVKDCHETLKECNWDIEAAKQKLNSVPITNNFRGVFNEQICLLGLSLNARYERVQ
jgi:hypothetical protein